jgi:glycosyltransferase involved in cell wall biosynthesis
VLSVAALIPAYQAAAHLGDVLMRLQALGAVRELLVVDDGSRDATPEVARQHGARVVSFAGNRGKGYALLAGFAALRDYDAVITLDADGQHPPECVPSFVRAAEEGADLVLGARAREGSMPPARRFANGFSSGWTASLAGQRVSDSQCGFRLHRREVLERTPLTPGRYEVETELIVRAARLGFRIAEVEIPTVYGEEKSQIHAFRDVPRIFGTLVRLTGEGIVPPAAMRRARRAGAADANREQAAS